MNKPITHTIFLLLLSQILGTVSQAQEDQRSNSIEMIGFYTDRSMYISGEDIHFSAAVLTQNAPGEKALSKVLYVEMINQKKDQILGEKFLVEDDVSTGLIKIPRDLSTGIYYIKSYTKFMRNFGPGSFNYCQIRVLNPFEESMQVEQPEAIGLETMISHRTSAEENKLFQIETDKTVYKPLDPVTLSVIPDVNRDSLKLTCISVVPSHAGEPAFIFTNGIERQSRNNDYISEYYGLTLTGLLLDNDSKLPLPSTKMELSILGENSDLIAVYTDPAGRFYFSLPRLTGQKTVFIGTEGSDSIIPSILVDNDFSPLSIDLPYLSFSLSNEEMKTALNLARNLQISEHYAGRSDTLANEPENQGDRPFYGTSTETLNTADYINLPTLEDYFNELPYLVKVRKLQGKKYLKILGSVSGIQFYEPLVLLDMISVYDLDAILSISSKQISHIDMINETYVKGNITYGGIVSIFSANNDFAGIDLPHSGLFINYDFLSASVPYDIGPVDSHIPDARNTLFWNGNFTFNSNAPHEISFLAGQSHGQYDIVVQGVLENCDSFIQIESFMIE